MADIVTRDAFRSPVRQMMERFFEDPFFRESAWRMPLPAAFTSEDGTLPLDIYEKDGALVVEASVPGFKKDEIDVRVEEGVLAIRAHREETHEEHGDKYYRRERSYGAVSRRVALPGIVKDAPVSAELRNGVLSLRIPLPKKEGPKQIEIQGE